MNQISKNHLADLRSTVAMPPVSDVASEPVGVDEAEILAPDGQEKAIGLRLAGARRTAKISKSAMARIIGRRGAQVITDYETGISKVPLGVVRKIAVATGTAVSWLWLGKPVPTCVAASAPAHSLAMDPQRPQPVLALPEAGDTAISLLASRVYRLWRESWTFDFGTPKRAELGDEMCDAEIDQRQTEALGLADKAMELPAANLTDAVFLLDLALIEADGLDAITQDDPTADARLDAIRRVLHGCCRAVALAAGVPLEGLLCAESRMDQVVFPNVAMPAVQAMIAPFSKPSTDAALPPDDQRLIAIDAEASRLIEQRSVFEAQWWTIPAPGSENYGQEDSDALTAIAAEINRSADRLDALTDESIKLAAISVEALRAKARLSQFWMRMSHAEQGVVDTESLDNDTHLLWSLLEDIVTGAVRPSVAHAVPAVGPSIEIITAIDAACDASADVHGRALDACGSVRIATLADAGAIAALALRYLADDDISGQGKVVTRGLLESLARHTPDVPNPDADMIAACAKVEDTWADYWRLIADQDARPNNEQRAFEVAFVEPAYDRAFEIYDQIEAGPMPRTTEGLRAVARAAIVTASDNRGGPRHMIEMGAPGSELAWKLIAHLAGPQVRRTTEGA